MCSSLVYSREVGSSTGQGCTYKVRCTFGAQCLLTDVMEKTEQGGGGTCFPSGWVIEAGG